MRPIDSRLLALTMALSAAGCLSVAPLIPPETSLVDVQFTDVSLFQTTAVVTLRLVNGNQEPIILDGAAYRVSLNGVSIGTGVSGDRVELPRLSSTTVSCPIHIANFTVAARGMKILESPELTYALESTVYVKHGRRTRAMKTEKTGTVTLRAEQTAPLRLLLGEAVRTTP